MIPVEADIALCVIIFFWFLTRGATETGLRLREQHLCSWKSLQKLLVTDLRCADQPPLKKLFGHLSHA